MPSRIRIKRLVIISLLMLVVLSGVARAETELHFTRGQELVLFNENGVMVYLTGRIEDTGNSWIRLDAIIENGNDFPVGITYDGTGNGWSIGRCYFDKVSAKSKASSYMFLEYNKLNITRFQDLEYITVSFEIYEPSSGSVINMTPKVYFRTDEITIRFSGDKNAVRNMVYFDESPSLPKPESYTDVDRGNRNYTAVNNKLRTLSYSYGPMNKNDKVADILDAYINGLKADGYKVSGSGKGYTVKNGSKKLCTITADNKMKVDIQLGNENLKTLPEAAAGKTGTPNKTGARQTLSPTMAPETPTPSPVPTPEETPAPPVQQEGNEAADSADTGAAGFQVKEKDGVLIVTDITADQAGDAGISPGDRLIAVGSHTVFTENDFINALAEHRNNPECRMIFFRELFQTKDDQSIGQLYEVRLKIGKDRELSADSNVSSSNTTIRPDKTDDPAHFDEDASVVFPEKVFVPENFNDETIQKYLNEGKAHLEDRDDVVFHDYRLDYPEYYVRILYDKESGKLYGGSVSVMNTSAKGRFLDRISVRADYDPQSGEMIRWRKQNDYSMPGIRYDVIDEEEFTTGKKRYLYIITVKGEQTETNLYSYSSAEGEYTIPRTDYKHIKMQGGTWTHIKLINQEIVEMTTTDTAPEYYPLLEIKIQGILDISKPESD